MFEVSSQMIVGGVVFVLVVLVFAHLQGRKVGRQQQNEVFHDDERKGFRASIAAYKQALGQAKREMGDVQETAIAHRREYQRAVKQQEEALGAVVEAQETKYKGLLGDAAKELSDADRRVDFFWKYACKLSLSADNGPQIRLRSERQPREEFDAALTKILAAEEAARDE